jgi:hypothetical protein
MLKRYDEFVLENKSTMRIFYSDSFRSLLKDIVAKSNRSKEISNILLESEDSYNDLDVYTAIDITDKSDMVSYIQVSRLERENPTGGTNIHRIPDVDLTSITLKSVSKRIWGDGRTPYYSIGRWVRHIFTDVKKKSISNTDLENFVDDYKKAFLSISIDEEKEINQLELVSGEEIRKWYLVDNYDDDSDGTELGKSCMRKADCQEYFGIYENNPEVCKLLILKSEDDPNKIRARALLWTLDNSMRGGVDELYLDRIYYTDKEDIEYYYKWCKENGVKFAYDNYNMGVGVNSLRYNATVQLGDHTYSSFPYMDTFTYYDPKEHELHQEEDRDFYKLQNTDGGYVALSDFVWSDKYGDYIDKDTSEYCVDVDDNRPQEETIYLEYKDVFVSDESSTVYSEFSDRNYLMDDAEYSECMGDWLCDKDEDQDIDLVHFYTNSSEDQDCCLKDDQEYYFEVDGENYSRENYLKDPYTGEYHFRDEKMENGDKFETYLDNKLGTEIKGVTVDILKDIKKLLLEYEPTDEFMDEISKVFKNYIEDEHSSEYLLLGVYSWLTINDMNMRNQPSFRERLWNYIFDFINLKYEDEDVISAIKSYYSEKYPVGKAYGFRRCSNFIDRLSSIDYSKLPVEIYKRILYLNI